MARRTQDIIFGATSQAIAHRLLSGRPTSATFKIFRDTQADDSTDPEVSGSATVDSVNTTVDLLSGPGSSVASGNPRRLNLASTAGMRTDRKYLLEENGLGEWIRPIEIVTDDYVICAYPLQRDYSTSATLKSTWIEADPGDAWVADEDNLSNQLDPDPDYRVRFEITNADSETEVRYEFFDLVRAVIGHSVELDDIADRWPDLVRNISLDHRREKAAPMINAAWRSIRAALHALDLNDAAIRDLEGIDEAVILRSRMLFAEAGWAPQNWDVADFYVMAKDAFDDFFGENYRTRLARRVSEGTGGEATSKTDAEIPFWSK